MNNPQTKQGNEGHHFQKKKNSLPPHGGREYTQRTIFRQS